MTRLLSLVIQISPAQTLEVVSHMGRAAQWFVLRQVIEAYSPELATRLHPSNNSRPQPYTASTLFEQGTARPLRGTVTPDDSAWLRITGIGAEVADAMTAWINRSPSSLELNDTDWLIRSVTNSPTDHPWAAQSDFVHLIQRGTQRNARYDFTLEFASPTAFHSESLHVPLPLPALLFRKLWDCWNIHAPVPMSEHLPTFARQFVEVIAASIQTDSVYLKNEPVIGFVGRTKYRLVRANAGLERLDATLAEVMQSNYADFARGLYTLAEFSFFSGIGIKTAMGMGMVRLLNAHENRHRR